MEDHMQEASSHEPEKKNTVQVFFLGLLGALAVCALIGYYAVAAQVRAMSTAPFVVSAATILRIPAATLNGEKILYADYLEDVKTLKKYYSSNPEQAQAPTDEQVTKQVLSRLLANQLVAMMAKRYNVSLDSGEKDRARQALFGNFATPAEAEAELQKQYGWSSDTYLAKVVYPLLREEKLAKTYVSSTDAFGAVGEEVQVRARHILFAVSDESKDAGVKAQAEDVLRRIEKGEDFAALAKTYGSDGTKDMGGDLGWFGQGDMVKPFEEAAFAMKPGERQVVKTEFGYHIVEVQETRTARSFSKFMDFQLKSARVKLYINAADPFEQMRLNG